MELGYDEIMNKGTRLDAALVKAMPCGGMNKQALMNRTYRNMLFGCMSKHKNAFVNMLAACKKANLYTPGSGQDNFSVMIVPAGMMELDQVTKRENMEFNIRGSATEPQADLDAARKRDYRPKDQPSQITDQGAAHEQHAVGRQGAWRARSGGHSVHENRGYQGTQFETGFDNDKTEAFQNSHL